MHKYGDVLSLYAAKVSKIAAFSALILTFLSFV